MLLLLFVFFLPSQMIDQSTSTHVFIGTRDGMALNATSRRVGEVWWVN